MKIAYIITRFDERGGAQIHVRDLALAMRERGDHPIIVTGSDGEMTAELAAAGIVTHVVEQLGRAIRPRRDLEAISEVVRLLRRQSPDVVSCHSSKAGVIGRLAARRCGVPCIFTAHGWAFTPGVPRSQRILYGAVEVAMAPLSAAIVTVSAFDLRLARRWLPHARRRLVAVHNGVHDVPVHQRSSPDIEPATGVFIGRAGPQKDHELALRALVAVPGARLRFVGAGVDNARFAQIAADLSIADRVSFEGETSSTAGLLADAQYFVLLSRWEGLPRSIIEAMRAGLPVLASDVGGVPELVEHDRTGLLVAPGDLGAAVRGLETMHRDADLRLSYGRTGRQRYEDSFTFARLVEDTLAIYERAATA